MKQRSKIWPGTDPEHDEQVEKLFDHLTRHVVCLTIEMVQIDEKGKKSEMEDVEIISCFVIAFEGIWFLATAGHAMKALDEKLKSGRIEILSCSIADYFGRDAPFGFSTPFPIADVEKAYLPTDETVLDFALIYVSPIFQKGMEQNKIAPIPESLCVPLERHPFAKFILVGFPASVVAEYNKPVPLGERKEYKLAPVLISATAIADKSEAASLVDLPSDYDEYFVGRIEPPDAPAVPGMSGCPIFGLVQDAEGHLSYSLVALQSGWFPSNRIITGASAHVFGKIAADAVRMKIALGPEASTSRVSCN